MRRSFRSLELTKVMVMGWLGKLAGGGVGLFVDGMVGIMGGMTIKHRTPEQVDWRVDWWLWPLALVMVAAGGGQAVWMWDHALPRGLSPLWMLTWIGLAAAGLTLPVYWLARRWWPTAGVAAAAWVSVPRLVQMAGQYRGIGPEEQWLYDFAPLLVLLALGLGLSGLMAGTAAYVGQRWQTPIPRTRPLRAGFWAALYVLICGWLMVVRTFSIPAAALLAGSLTLIETYIVLREGA